MKTRSLAWTLGRLRAALPILLLVLSPGLVFAIPATAQGPEPGVPSPAAERAAPALASLDALDVTRLALRESLHALLEGRLPESVSVSSLFGVALDDQRAVAARVGELEASKAALERRIGELEQRPAALAAEEEGKEEDGSESTPAPGIAETTDDASIIADADSMRLELEIVDLRLRALRPLSRSLGQMTEAARRILPTLGDRRKSLREHASLIAEVGSEARALDARVQRLASRARSGLLVGFISERRELTSEAELLAAAMARQGQQLTSLAEELVVLASTMESAGAGLRDAILRSMVRSDRQEALDQLFLTHLRAQRRLRKSVSQVLGIPGQQELEALRDEIRATLPAPPEIGTTSDAQFILGAAADLRERIASLVSIEVASRNAWKLAFENEVVTVLSEQASSEVRNDAYGLSAEILDDILSEVSLAWERLRDELRAHREEIPSWTALVSSAPGQGYLLRAAGVLLILGIWLVLRRQTSRMTVFFVKILARLPALRGHVGAIVRSFGLIERILPALLGLIGLQIAIEVLGRSAEAGRTLRALLLPLLVYLLGRQALIGATRRLARGRPALIELPSATRDRLQRTYATLGLVIAFGTMLDGIARIGIGAGRLVSLLDAAVLAWIGVWAAWEAFRWRTPLSQTWTRLLSETEEGETTIEGRLAQWMGTHRLGFLLSPVALLRLVGTAFTRFVGSLATRTSLIQSLRAQRLRRRSKQATEEEGSQTTALPQEYLAAFPMHPILGEDDSILVPRKSLLSGISEQLDRWSESKAGGSLALIGEKGIGKTTLAALIGKRTHDLEIVHHTIRGKPGTEKELLSSLAPIFGELVDLDDLVETLRAGPERIVLLDEAHNVFLRRVGGYEAYDSLVELVNSTSSKVFWVLVFNSFTWRFLSESRGRVQYFRKLLYLPGWSADEIQQLIRLRHEPTGFDLEFDEMLLSDEKSGSPGLELVEGSEGYFRILWDSSGGNPRIATQLWLDSLTHLGDSRLRVGLFREPDSEVLSSLPDDLLFALAAICQHENLTSEELAIVMNVSERFTFFAVAFLTESGFLEPKDTEGERYTLSPKYYRAVLRILKSKHLLFD